MYTHEHNWTEAQKVEMRQLEKLMILPDRLLYHLRSQKATIRVKVSAPEHAAHLLEAYFQAAGYKTYPEDFGFINTGINGGTTTRYGVSTHVEFLVI